MNISGWKMASDCEGYGMDSNPNSQNDSFISVPDSENENVPEPVVEIELDMDDMLQLSSDNDSIAESFIIEHDEAVQTGNDLYPDIFLENFPKDKELEEDIVNGWLKVEPDDDCFAPLLPFLGESTLCMISDGRLPLDFFDALFDNRMWETIADATNIYAHRRKAV